jgi:NADPH:quinone reductase-like Zn-dependent oxidoreductase
MYKSTSKTGVLTRYTHPLKVFTEVTQEMSEAGDLKVIVDSVHSLENGIEASEKLSKGKANGEVVIKCD